jgi:surface polysaccharide O-acyltransferase-like enzyme
MTATDVSPDDAGTASLGPTRLAYIGYLRVLAILGVIAIHVAGLTVIRPRLSHTTVWWLAEALNQCSRWAVPMFVMVSGALVLRRSAMEVPLGQYYRKRLSRIVPALVAWHVIYIVFELAIGQHLTLKSVTVGILLGRTYTALYFFWLILGLYIVAPLLWRMIAGRPDREQAWIAGGFLVAALCWASLNSVLTALGVHGTAGIFTVLTYWVPYVGYFMLGPVLAKVTMSTRVGTVATVVLVASLVITYWQAVEPTVTHKLDVLSPVGYFGWFIAAATISLFLAARWWFAEGSVWSRAPLGPFVAAMGALTLGVFAVHLIVLYGLQHRPFHGLTLGATTVPQLAYLYSATVVLSFAAAWIASKVPYLRRIV